MSKHESQIIEAILRQDESAITNIIKSDPQPKLISKQVILFFYNKYVLTVKRHLERIQNELEEIKLGNRKGNDISDDPVKKTEDFVASSEGVIEKLQVLESTDFSRMDYERVLPKLFIGINKALTLSHFKTFTNLITVLHTLHLISTDTPLNPN